ncbi:MAG: hypothetical protein ABFS14_03800 [Gemmatimonadota bacterium]
MTTSIQAAGDKWTVRMSEEDPRDGYTAVLFFCTSSRGQRPYRVSLVEQARVRTDADLEALTADEVRGLFESSRSMASPGV